MKYCIRTNITEKYWYFVVIRGEGEEGEKFQSIVELSLLFFPSAHCRQLCCYWNVCFALLDVSILSHFNFMQSNKRQICA